ncbi:hypothetical protein [Chryseobacterium lathyri]|uniref:Outer membrane protein beta-barrel domain-containing protein n=1 Tax=Chryseobacterium lathyri TaxID=395933 RepID=A0ABT9SKK9_9FLAO|nr:hypothetical protein [Chryseobacterium lathyri]MDP9959957.1 hypothetical protein [Chryseobacterium lathyri]MDQ0064488.1 hypothetical protein [Chryseobacterium lathyri]
MKLYSFLLLCLLATTAHAQILDKTALNIAYRYTGRNIIQGGLEFKTNTAREQSLIVGASMLYTSIKHKDKFLPEANIYYTNIKGRLMGVSVNPYSIEPRIGFSFINTFYINTGYAIPIHRDKFFKGITFGLQFNIAPVKNSKFYDYLKWM